MSRKSQNREQIVQKSLVSTVNLFVKFTFHSMQTLLMSCCGGGGEAGRFQHLGVFFNHFPGLLPLQGWKKMGGNRSQRDMSICFLKLRDRGSKMWMWKEVVCGAQYRRELLFYQGGGSSTALTICATFKAVWGWERAEILPEPLGEITRVGFVTTEMCTVQTGKAGWCSSEMCSVYFSAKSGRKPLYSVALLHRAGKEAWQRRSAFQSVQATSVHLE